MPHTWQDALNAYRYPVDLADFSGAQSHDGWFIQNTGEGGRQETIAFEDRFRELGPYQVEAWYEVVFWKLYTTPQFRQQTTQDVILRLTDDRTTAARLWEICSNYVEYPSRRTFQNFRQNLFVSNVVATAATFPAFIDPERFPMIDTNIVRWAYEHGEEHNYRAMGGPNLVRIPHLGPGRVLNERHWLFIESWIEWCRFTAGILNQRAGHHWRTRDVEMAVFTAQRRHLPLTPLV